MRAALGCCDALGEGAGDVKVQIRESSPWERTGELDMADHLGFSMSTPSPDLEIEEIEPVRHMPLAKEEALTEVRKLLHSFFLSRLRYPSTNDTKTSHSQLETVPATKERHSNSGFCKSTQNAGA